MQSVPAAAPDGADRSAPGDAERIGRLALPALGALVAEPLFVLTDTAMVGHLGVDALAGLGIASTVLNTAVGLLVVLAYATTPTVARLLGRGDRASAVRAGIDGMWFALALGVVLLAAGALLADSLVAPFAAGVGPAAAEAATVYLRISAWGLPGMLVVIAATGLLRGLQNTRTPLVVAVAGFAANAGLNAVLIYGAGLGVAGSALGTVLAQSAMAVAYAVVAVRAARGVGTTVRPRLRGLRSLAISAGWMLLRTASLRAGLLLTVAAAASLGAVPTATTQIAMSLFFLLALALDALAIAAQALIAHDRGAGDARTAGMAALRIRGVTRTLVRLGLGVGVALGAVVAALAWAVPHVFTSNAAVLAATTPTLLLLAACLPLGGYVFVLDGVLIGAEDGRYLALTGLANLAVYLPLLAWVALARPTDASAAAWLWVAFGFGYLGARAVTLGLRVRTDRWIRLDATG